MQKKPSNEYPSTAADVLEDYIRRNVRISPRAWHVYAGLRWVERDKENRFCETVFTSYRELSALARVDVKSISKVLCELHAAGLIVLQVGSPRLSEKQGTAITRVPLDALRGVTHPQIETAARLAAALSGKPILFNGREEFPVFTVSRTGRVNSSRPNLQGIPEDERKKGLSAAIPEGCALFYADICQAEPTVIKHVLGIRARTDCYKAWMDATGDKRPEAKKAINRIAYAKNTEGCVSHWPIAAQKHPSLSAYVKALLTYRDNLAETARKTKRVLTLSGRAITWGSGTRPHKGNFLSWQMQGTVADVVNTACLDLLADAKALLPVHDAIYAVLPREFDKDHIALILKNKASIHGMRINVKSWATVPETDTGKRMPSISIPESDTAISELTPPKTPFSVPESATHIPLDGAEESR